MPSYHIFHQNMRVFAGGNDRDDLFEDAMSDISGELGLQDRVLVAAFTEVMNNGNSRQPLRDIARALDPSLRRPVLYAVGITAVGAQTEWVAISTYTTFNVQIQGKVLKMTNNTWQAFPSTAVATDLLPVGVNYQADVRGLAYVGGTFGGQQYLFGFMHNNYTLGEPSTIYRALPQMVAAIDAAHAGANWGTCTRFLGGDFNLYPNDIQVGYEALAAKDEDGVEINTTFHHPYDFWVTNHPTLNEGDCQIYTRSRWENDSKLSDHAGVGLQIL